MNEKISNWKDTTWQIRPILDMPELDPEAVQITVFDSDPCEDYRKIIIKNRDRFLKEIEYEMDSMQRELLKRAQMTNMWDSIFKATTGARVYLLGPPRSKKNESVSRSFILSSSDAAGQKWLTTKIVYHDDTPMCWCISVKTVIGASVEIQLRKENALDIKRLYDDTIGVR